MLSLFVILSCQSGCPVEFESHGPDIYKNWSILWDFSFIEVYLHTTISSQKDDFINFVI